MKSREQEYKEIFIAEALEYYDALNRHISTLEKNPDDEDVLSEIFRLLHNLKANAKAIGYIDISDLAHKLETAFGLIRSKELSFTDETVTVLFDGIDMLGELLHNLDNANYPGPDQLVLRNLDVIVENISDSSVQLDKVERQQSTTRNIQLSDLIYIQIRKLDHLLNLVGELIIDRDRILSLSREIESDELKSVGSHLYRITEELQYSVMDARLVSIGSLFNKFPRVVRDVAMAEQKDVEISISGQDIQIDRNILQIMTDSLLHLVRNAVSHGIEGPEERLKAGKDVQGHLYLSASTDRETVLVKVEDDGAGINLANVRRKAIESGLVTADRADEMSSSDLLSLIFEPGFSLSKEVTEFSGRGVGLDVVKNALDAIGGHVRVNSEPGKGTTFTLLLPTSIAVKGALLFEVDHNFYAIPLIHTDSVVSIKKNQLHEVGSSLVADIKGESIMVVSLRELFNQPAGEQHLGDKAILGGEEQNVVIVFYNNRRIGLLVDRLIRQQDIVVKPLNKPVDSIDLYSGVTLLGTGKICLVLDVPAIVKQLITR